MISRSGSRRPGGDPRSAGRLRRRGRARARPSGPGQWRGSEPQRWRRRREEGEQQQQPQQQQQQEEEEEEEAGGLLAPLMGELDRMAPSFDVRGEDIRIIRTPAEFYEALKDRIRNAKKRIFLSTLYIGKSERELIEALGDALRRNGDLRLSILTDALRGTRESPNPSCASLLAPLVAEFGAERVEVRMYHTPNLTGMRKQYIPKRINEGWGLQHMKLYGVDDEIIMSGANLSTDYFTNRQDRYHLFSSKAITDHFWNLHSGVSSLSFLVDPCPSAAGYSLSWPASNAAPSPLLNPRAFIRHATHALQPLLAPKQQSSPLPPPPSSSSSSSSSSCSSSSLGSQQAPDTRVYMLGQMTQVMRPDGSTELPVLMRILERLATPSYAGSAWTFTAGYFNPDPSLTRLLLGTRARSGVVITAAPEANGFYRSRGVSGLLPDAYVLLARRFLQAVHDRARVSPGPGPGAGAGAGAGADTSPPTPRQVALKEWRLGTAGRPGGWTYHAKGLWVTLPGDAAPSVSIVGSSNYTRRSYSLDLEAGALVVTRNEALRRRLGEEQAWLQEHAGEVTLDDFTRLERRVSLKVRVAMWIVRVVGGAL
ncbi:CDP-diacylglycerol--glycerol-3-phosphate 3-phosphatidyltransferase [Escovopsis weberi]|uniref:CDP-diacylglycerol--glycerol-3-phosphate 3-phosphatidyltransferase n=1 Tax=Escovopsis weberi TaxID=150374 RepID=A0A0M9VS01_ESCWE|nr:CDP-diacylglycerol--glycerol-3-phosphate 3-phosphatidyltransferase [Escovopsis weberi]